MYDYFDGGIGIMTDIAKSIKAINPNAEFTYSEEDINTVQWLNGTTPIPKAEIEAEVARLEQQHTDTQYQRDRQYPSIGDQLDMIYHDQVDSTTTFKDAIKAIKDANPKP